MTVTAERATNDRRLWAIDRERVDYSTLPMLLDSVFMLPYEKQLVRSLVTSATYALDLWRTGQWAVAPPFSCGRDDQHAVVMSEDDVPLVLAAGGRYLVDPYNVSVTFVEDTGSDGTGNMFAVISDCFRSYLDEWNMFSLAQPADLFESTERTWDRLFPSGQIERHQGLTWTMLDNDHRVDPLRTTLKFPLMVDFMVPSASDRLASLDVRSADHITEETKRRVAGLPVVFESLNRRLGPQRPY